MTDQGRHCEERSDEAIQSGDSALDCFASLAIANLGEVARVKPAHDEPRVFVNLG
jgi:hypothetical protein